MVAYSEAILGSPGWKVSIIPSCIGSHHCVKVRCHWPSVKIKELYVKLYSRVSQ